jgi:N-acetylneuraminic acid mutarotase
MYWRARTLQRTGTRRAALATAAGGAALVAVGVGRAARNSQGASGGTWRAGPEMRVQRTEVAAATARGTIYVVGGLAGSGHTLNAVEALAPGADTWSDRAPLPEPRDHLGAVSLDERLWVVAGSPGWFNQSTSQTLWVYDAAADRWEGRAPLPLGRAAHAAAVADARLYVAGGMGPQPERLMVYDPRLDSWSLRAPMPRPLEHLAAAGLGGKVYVVGGRWSDVGNVGSLWEYDPAADRWRELPSMPTPRGGLAAAVLGGRLYVTGGEALDESRITFPQLEVFTPAGSAGGGESGSWNTAPPTPTGRHGLAAAVRDGELYVLSGGRLAGLEVSAVTEIYTPGA